MDLLWNRVLSQNFLKTLLSPCCQCSEGCREDPGESTVQKSEGDTLGLEGNFMAMSVVDETTPMLARPAQAPGVGASEPSNDYDRIRRVVYSKCFVVLVPAVIVALLLLGEWNETQTKADISRAMEAESSHQRERSEVMYRPRCTVYSKRYSVTSIVQTSLGQPSRQWTPLECENARHNNRMQSFLESFRPKGLSKDELLLNTYGAPDAILQVNLSHVAHPNREPIMGFGGAFTEASSLNYHSLSKTGQETLMELLFGKSGLGYSLGRVHINSCDFCVASYSFDEVEDDFDLVHFDSSVQHDVTSGMIDMMLKAASVVRDQWRTTDEFKIMASPWSPPSWMKKPLKHERNSSRHASNMTNSAEPNCLREGVGPESRYAKAWALYFAKFISAYKELGIPLFSVSVQNEPEFPAPWEACAYTPKTQGDFLAYHLGPVLRGIHPDIKIFMFDHNKDHAPVWANALLNASHPASSFVDGTAIHWYAGGMDRLLDGGVGSPNMHRLVSDMSELNVKPEHLILGSEACHCPTTGYAGGDINVAWARAERYAHTILADLAAGSNGWIEWNLILDAIGGPNHLGNVCDAPILAVPHRANTSTVMADELGYPLPVFEPSDHPFGRIVGDGRTREELNALGFPAEFLDAGIVVQPLYFYVGHISRHVRPGSRSVLSLVQESEGGPKEQTFRPIGQTVAGGGINDLARFGIEITAWPCEGSTRQQFKYNDAKQLQVFGHDWLGEPTTNCVGKKADKDFRGLLTTACNAKAGIFDLVPAPNDDYLQVEFVHILLTNGNSDPSESCLVLKPLKNEGGALGPRGGAQVTIGNCKAREAFWIYTEATGEISSPFFCDLEGGGEVCLTTGWPFLQVGAFDSPNGDSDKTVVVLNEASETANYAIREGEDVILTSSIPAHAIQTLSLNEIKRHRGS